MGVSAWIEEQEPGAGIAGEDGFNALTIEPAGCFDGFRATDGRDVGIDEAVEAVGYAGGYAGKAGTGGGKDNGGVCGAAKSFKGSGVCGITRLGVGFAGDSKHADSCGG